MRDIIIAIVVVIVLYMWYQNYMATQAAAAIAAAEAASTTATNNNSLHSPLNSLNSTVAPVPVLTNVAPTAVMRAPLPASSVAGLGVSAQANIATVTNNFTTSQALMVPGA